ncbi:MAG: hypothetical protein J6S96_07865 [Muribaculaceae bacterium]|nr:hypothetical protein [Muribaculaceae bacterium]
MEYYSHTQIKTIEDVEQFVKHIYDLGINFHPDDDFHDIINYETGKKSFYEADADLYNNLVDSCFSICKRENVDFYEIAYNYHPIFQAQIDE